MLEQRISDTIYNALLFIDCKACKYHSEEVPEFCTKCKSRNNNYWSISRAKANEIAKKIVEGK